ncbi:MAG: hypothetical protein WAN65_25685 [Candidatus Sulfotelmatobacter sp.]
MNAIYLESGPCPSPADYRLAREAGLRQEPDDEDDEDDEDEDRDKGEDEDEDGEDNGNDGYSE